MYNFIHNYVVEDIWKYLSPVCLWALDSLVSKVALTVYNAIPRENHNYYSVLLNNIINTFNTIDKYSLSVFWYKYNS